MRGTSAGGRRALIVGLGASGMATALRLHQIGWTAVVVERAATRRTGGYFVGIFGSGRSAAKRLGLASHLHDRRPTGVAYDYDRKGNRRVGMSFADLPGEAWAALRGDVETAAFQALPDDMEIRYSTVPTKIDQHDGTVSVTLTNTADGAVTTEEFDLVVGADGLRSTVRALAFGPHEKYLRRLNNITASFELQRKLSDLALEDGAWLMEPGRSLIIYPFSDAGPDPLGTVLDCYPEDLNRALIEWERTLRPLIRAYQHFGVRQRFFFTPDNRLELLLRQGMARLRQMRFTRPLFARIAQGSRAGRLKDQDIATVGLTPRLVTTDAFAEGAEDDAPHTVGAQRR